jgi:hypothetical protein
MVFHEINYSYPVRWILGVSISTGVEGESDPVRDDRNKRIKIKTRRTVMRKTNKFNVVVAVMMALIVIVPIAVLAVTITQEYTNPSNNIQGTKSVVLDIVSQRIDPSDSASETFMLRAYDASVTTTKTDINLDRIVRQLLDGRESSAYPDVIETYLAATTPSVVSTYRLEVESNSNFAVGDAIAIGTTYSALTGNRGVTYSVVTGYSDNTILWILSPVTTAYQAGAIVQRLRPYGSSLNLNGEIGIKSKFERPASPVTVTVSTTTSTGGKFRVGWTASASTTGRYYDVFVSPIAGGVLETTIPTYSDATWSTNTTNVNVGLLVTAPISTTAYYIGVVTKDATGIRNVNKSGITWSGAAYTSSP